MTPQPLECVVCTRLRSGGSGDENGVWSTGRPKAKRATVFTLANGYHGDTFGAMSVWIRTTQCTAWERHICQKTCLLPPAKPTSWAKWDERDMVGSALPDGGAFAHEIAAVIIEPIVQAQAGCALETRQTTRQTRDLQGILADRR
ncbi:aminotransferase class III-fold pyridoxal phosphate-dependent enzyme [Escherichia coli]